MKYDIENLIEASVIGMGFGILVYFSDNSLPLATALICYLIIRENQD